MDSTSLMNARLVFLRHLEAVGLFRVLSRDAASVYWSVGHLQQASLTSHKQDHECAVQGLLPHAKRFDLNSTSPPSTPRSAVRGRKRRSEAEEASTKDWLSVFFSSRVTGPKMTPALAACICTWPGGGGRGHCEQSPTVAGWECRRTSVTSFFFGNKTAAGFSCIDFARGSLKSGTPGDGDHRAPYGKHEKTAGIKYTIIT